MSELVRMYVCAWWPACSARAAFRNRNDPRNEHLHSSAGCMRTAACNQLAGWGWMAAHSSTHSMQAIPPAYSLPPPNKRHTWAPRPCLPARWHFMRTCFTSPSAAPSTRLLPPPLCQQCAPCQSACAPPPAPMLTRACGPSVCMCPQVPVAVLPGGGPPACCGPNKAYPLESALCCRGFTIVWGFSSSAGDACCGYEGFHTATQQCTASGGVRRQAHRRASTGPGR